MESNYQYWDYNLAHFNVHSFILFIITQNRDHYNKSSFFFTIIVLLSRRYFLSSLRSSSFFLSFILLFLRFLFHELYSWAYPPTGLEYSWLEYHYDIIMAFPFLLLQIMLSSFTTWGLFLSYVNEMKVFFLYNSPMFNLSSDDVGLEEVRWQKLQAHPSNNSNNANI